MGLTYISTGTASGDPATISFTSGIDDTYNEYQFHMVNIHPSSDGTVGLSFQVNAHDGSSQLTGFDETITSTAFRAIHREDGADGGMGYQAARDQAQGTAYQNLWAGAGADNDQAGSGILTLYAPSSTTYVKHFVSRSQFSHDGDYSIQFFTAGYINTTSAIDEISFAFATGNIDAGTIHMYGVG